MKYFNIKVSLDLLKHFQVALTICKVNERTFIYEWLSSSFQNKQSHTLSGAILFQTLVQKQKIVCFYLCVAICDILIITSWRREQE